MAMFHLLKIKTSIDILKNGKCKVTFGLEYIFQVLCVLCFTRQRYQVSVYRTIGPPVNRMI